MLLRTLSGAGPSSNENIIFLVSDITDTSMLQYDVDTAEEKQCINEIPYISLIFAINQYDNQYLSGYANPSTVI
jgi:hypothetical protein